LLQRSDLSLMHKWLSAGPAQKWYGKGQASSYQAVADHYMPYIEGRKPTQAFLIRYDDQPIGYIQTYLIRDYPDYSSYVQVEEGAAGLDLFIGEEDFIHKGLGVAIIKKFLGDFVFVNPRVTCCALGPEPDNIGAIRTYEKAGFKYIKSIQLAEAEEPERIMVLKKEDFIA